MKIPNEDAESLLLFGCQVGLSNTEWGAAISTVHTTESLVALLETGDDKMVSIEKSFYGAYDEFVSYDWTEEKVGKLKDLVDVFVRFTELYDSESASQCDDLYIEGPKLVLDILDLLQINVDYPEGY